MIDYEINPKYIYLKEEILSIPSRFEKEGEIVETGRNVIKVIQVNDLRFNVKSFKIPNFINRFAYAYVRKSKAERSYTYARLLLHRQVGTPEPVAYLIYKNIYGITRSFYISLQQEYDYLFRDLKQQRPEGWEEILRAFTRFTWYFHTQGIYFIDHSPGNTLIKKEKNCYHFYLVDLNRIKFMKISPQIGLKNFYRLNASDDMIEIIAKEYARLTHSDAEMMNRCLREWTHQHDAEVMKRKKRKGRL